MTQSPLSDYAANTKKRLTAEQSAQVLFFNVEPGQSPLCRPTTATQRTTPLRNTVIVPHRTGYDKCFKQQKYAPKTYFSVRVFLLRVKVTILKKLPTLSCNYVQSVRVRTLAVNKSRYTKPNTILKLKRIIKTEKCASCVSFSYIPPSCNKNISIFIFFN